MRKKNKRSGGLQKGAVTLDEALARVASYVLSKGLPLRMMGDGIQAWQCTKQLRA